jgi:hypothetical protein
MTQIKTSIIYVGNNINQWQVKEYIVSEHLGDWNCSCAIKYKRNPKYLCKHIEIAQKFLLTAENKEKVMKRTDEHKLRAKFKGIKESNCTHSFKLCKSKGKIAYFCLNCDKILEIKEYKLYNLYLIGNY